MTTTLKKLWIDDRCSAKGGKRVAKQQSGGLVDGGARTEYFNFLRGWQYRVGAGESSSLERFGWPVCRGWLGGGKTGG